MSSEILGLQWLEHPNIFNQAIGSLRNKSAFTDATLACEGKFYPVHKFVLSTCSEYFSAIFDWTPCVNPVVVINNIPSSNLESLLDFMYKGEAHVQECHIQDVMKAAECLHIKGLSLRQEDSLLNKIRSRSPLDIDEEEEEESKKKRRKSESKRRCSHYAKPQLQAESCIMQQEPPLTSTPFTNRPPPTSPPNTPIHPNSQQPISSSNNNTTNNSPLHSASLTFTSSVLSSSTQQSQFQSSHLSTPTSPKSLWTPVSRINVQSQPIKMLPHYKETTESLQLESFQAQSPNQRHRYLSLKDEPTNLVFSSIPNLVTSEESSVGISISEDQSSHFAKFVGTVMPARSSVVHHESLEVNVPGLSQLHQKLIGIGEELHLDGPVKELEISTEDGTVSIPEILEGLVDMRHLYETKVVQSEDIVVSQGDTYLTSEPKQMEVIPQCSTSGTSVTLLHFKEETNDSMYEFREEIPETSGIIKMNTLKDKNLKTYSSNGSNLKKKNNNIQMDNLSKSSSDGESSKASLLDSLSSPEVKKEVKGPFVCTTCDKVCKKKDSLTRHMRTHSEFPYTCTVCSLKCKAYKEFINHRKIHATKRCDKCDFVTIRNDNLRRHMLSHLEEKHHKCPYEDCTYSSMRSSLLGIHIQNHHTKKINEEEKK